MNPGIYCAGLVGKTYTRSDIPTVGVYKYSFIMVFKRNTTSIHCWLIPEHAGIAWMRYNYSNWTSWEFLTPTAS